MYSAITVYVYHVLKVCFKYCMVANDNNPTGNDYALNMEPEVVPSAAHIGKCNCKHISLKSFINLLQLSVYAITVCLPCFESVF